MNLRYGFLSALSLGCAVALTTTPAFAQAALSVEPLSALARANLDKPRPKPPFDLSGTWNVQWNLTAGLPRFSFIPPPKFTPRAQAMVDKYDEYVKKGLEYRDDAGACWPLGMPKMLTRIWPLQVIQLPTMIVQISMFNNSVRWIYTDGRPHPALQDLAPSYNGHSIGHWEGDTLVVDTVGMTDDHHWVDEGVPAGPKLHIIERIKLTNGGTTFEDQLTMTDPDDWEGQWVNTLHFKRDDRTDIEESACIYEQMRQLPSFKYNVRE
jgi:hypothetical protein